MTRGEQVGSNHIQCTVQAGATTILCDAAFVFANGSQLHGSVNLSFDVEASGQPFQVAVTGGTGDWFGATGAVTVTDTSTEQESSALYEAKVVLPHR